MTETRKPASSPDSLTKASADAGIALSEEQLKNVAGGTLNAGYKAGGALKIDTVQTPDLKMSFHK
jgi:hypothetical protein